MDSDIVYNLSRFKTIPGKAVFSEDEKYRYTLTRTWDESKPACNFLMMNPSTANASILDPTVSKCLKWAILWGYGQLIVTNLFAYRSTNVKQIYRVTDPIGPDNDYHLEQTLEMCKDGLVVAAFGNHSKYMSRNLVAEALAVKAGARLYCLRTTKLDLPQHPLYLKLDTKPTLWRENNAKVCDDFQSRQLGDTQVYI